MKEQELLKILAFDGIEAARAAIESESGRINAELQYKANMEVMNLFEEFEKLPPNEIVDRSYELTMKKDILIILENEDLPLSYAEKLPEKEYPIDAIYQEWLDNDYSYMDMLRETVNDYAKKEIVLYKREKTSMHKTIER